MERLGSSLPPAPSSAMDDSAEAVTTPGDTVETTSGPVIHDNFKGSTDSGVVQHDSDILSKAAGPSRERPGRRGVLKCDRCRRVKQKCDALPDDSPSGACIRCRQKGLEGQCSGRKLPRDAGKIHGGNRRLVDSMSARVSGDTTVSTSKDEGTGGDWARLQVFERDIDIDEFQFPKEIDSGGILPWHIVPWPDSSTWTVDGASANMQLQINQPYTPDIAAIASPQLDPLAEFFGGSSQYFPARVTTLLQPSDETARFPPRASADWNGGFRASNPNGPQDPVPQPTRFPPPQAPLQPIPKKTPSAMEPPVGPADSPRPRPVSRIQKDVLEISVLPTSSLDPEQLGRIRKSAIAWVAETHCFAHEPMNRWPTNLTSAKFDRGLDEIESVLVEDLEVATNLLAKITYLWNLPPSIRNISVPDLQTDDLTSLEAELKSILSRLRNGYFSDVASPLVGSAVQNFEVPWYERFPGSGGGDVIDYLELECGRETAFLFAAKYGITATIQLLLKHYPEVIHAVNRQQSTALHLALLKTFGFAHILISAGADIQARDRNGNTPLHIAALSPFDTDRDVSSLLDAKADVIAHNDQGLTPWHFASMEGRKRFLCFLKHIESSVDENGQPLIDRALNEVQPELEKCVAAEKGDGYWGLHQFRQAVDKENVSLFKAFLVGGFHPDAQLDHRSTALHLLLARFPPNVQMVQSLLTANANIFIPDSAGDTPFKLAAHRQDREISSLFRNHMLSQRLEAQTEAVVAPRLVIKSPVTLSNHVRLCDLLLDSVEEFYAILDNLQNSGFALGFDILRNDLVLAESSVIQFFTGTYSFTQSLYLGRREMLWIEYDSTSTGDMPIVKDAIERIAKLVPPFPVAAYDTRELGIGLLVHDGFYPGYDDGSSATSSTASREISPWSFVDVFPEMSADPSESAVMEDVVSTSANFVTDAMELDNSDGHGDQPTDNARGRAPVGSGDNENTHGSSRGPTNPLSGNDGPGGGNDEDTDGNSDAPPPTPPPTDSGLCTPSGKFTGRTKLRFGSAGTQDLSISFDLQIEPSPQRGTVNCAISIDNLVVRASNSAASTSVPLSARFITDRVSITVGPTGRCYPPEAVSPLEHYFAERQTISVRNQYGASFEAAAQPRFTLQGSRSIEKSVDRRAVTLAVEPLGIGAGEGDDIHWFYKTQRAAESHLELSSRNPPTHEVSYPISSTSSNMPDCFRIKVEAFYHRKRIPRRLLSDLPAMFRFFKDVTVRDLVMTLETTIGSEQADNFMFPGMNKEGDDLFLEVNFMDGGNIGQGVPITGGRGCVKSQLSTATKCA